MMARSGCAAATAATMAMVMTTICVMTTGCEESGRARSVSQGSSTRAATPTWEPEPGDGPRCDAIGARFTARGGPAKTVTAQVQGAEVELPFDLAAAKGTAIRDLCRSQQWTRGQRECAIAFDGDVVADLVRFQRTCLGAGTP